MVKRALLLLLLALPVYAGDIIVDKFCGLNTQDSPATLAPCEAQDLLNVDITPGGKSVKKRDGEALSRTLPISTAAVHGIYLFQDASGNNVQLYGNGEALTASVSGGPSVQIATGTNNTTWQCTDNAGFAYCFTSSRNTPVRTAGTVATTTYQLPVATGTMATSTPDRLVVAGVSGNASSLYFSAANTFTSFETGVQDPSPFIEVINSAGSRITHVRYACGKVLWWKDQSFGYSLGTTQFDLDNTVISPNIGTLDNSSDEYNGHVYFRGQDNHIYDYDCSNVTRLSRPITPTVAAAGRRLANSWTQTSQNDFLAGSSLYIDTTTVPGSIQLLGFHDSFASLGNWTLSHFGGSDFSVSNGVVTSNLALVGDVDVMVTNAGKVTYSSTTIHEAIRFSYSNATAGQQDVLLYIGSETTSGGMTNNYSVCPSINAPKITYNIKRTDSTIATGSTATADTGYHILGLSRTQDGTLTGYYDGVSKVSVTNTEYNVPTFSSASVRCELNSGGPHQCSITNFDESTSTGTYYSAVNNAPNLSSWGTLSENDSTVGTSTITYYVRASTGQFTVNSSTPAWTLQTKNSLPNYSTGTYMQLRSEFVVLTATEAANTSISDLTFNWNEGTAADKAYIKYFNDMVWVAVSSGTGGINNQIQRWDLLNQTWLIDNIGSNGFLVDNNALYIAGPSSGKIYKFGGVSTDEGAAILGFWKSKDFMGNDPFVKNEFVSADFIVKQASETISAIYTVDSSSPTTITLNLYDPVRSLLKRSTNLATGKIGAFYSIKFSDNSGNPKFEILGHRVHFNALPWRPE